ncbi:MAG: arginase family protein [Acidobacteria bacterium]|nr:arginase family protein [Acidobacteriota bacterium]
MPLSYSIVEVPYHLGMQDVAVGKGPASLLKAGVDQILASKSMPATVNHVRPRDLRNQGQDAIVDINRMLRYAVKEAVEQETIPVVLAGNCNSCVGTIAGLRVERLGIVWFDKHPDFHTPETSISGNIEGMALAMAVGQCHQEFLERVGLERPVEERNVILGCFWDVETGERERLEESWVSAHAVDSLGLLPVALDQLKDRVDAIYFHIDTDFVTGVDNPANFVSLVRESIPIAAVGITNYNPDIDENGEWLEEILKVARALQPGTMQ